ncbi:MAG TPA: hypothetical protein VFV80_08000 [Geminicoccaceae bacterium]|nr:hypothetical protein [Geminicoccaceae bacterium]
MASTVAAQTRDFARRFLEVVQELGREDWVAAKDAFERTVSAHPDHPYLAYLRANQARKAGFSAAAERIRLEEFPQIERRKAGTRRNAPVFYRIARPDAGFSFALPYDVPASHPLRTAKAARGNPLRRPPEAREARSPWRRRQDSRRTVASADAAAGWWRKLIDGVAGLVDRVGKAGSKRPR